MAENFALHQCFRDRGTIDRHKRPVGPRRQLVQRSRHDFLARPGLAGDQHGRRTWRRHLHDAHHFLHRLRPADEISEPSRLAQLALQHQELARIARFAQRAVQQCAQHRTLQRFFDVPEGSGFDRRHRALFAAFAGNDDRWHIVEFRAELLQQVQPVHPRQFHVGNQRVGLVARKFRQRLFRRRHADDVAAPALQKLLVALSRIVFVFDNQDAVLALHHFDGPYRRPSLFPHES